MIKQERYILEDRGENMYCPHCGQHLNDGDMFCSRCGASVKVESKYCQNCGTKVDGYVEVCPQCGYHFPKENQSYGTTKSRIVVGIIALFFGELGIHNFYLGYTSKGLAQLILCFAGFLTCGITSLVSWVWALVDAIYIFIGKINEDSDGNPLV